MSTYRLRLPGGKTTQRLTQGPSSPSEGRQGACHRGRRVSGWLIAATVGGITTWTPTQNRGLVIADNLRPANDGGRPQG